MKISQSDKMKRTQLLAEFLYWLFDSFIISLISAHFYVTESSISNSQKIYYFRHDLWRKLTEPALQQLKLVMFEEFRAEHRQEPRRLGYCGVRLLPKESGFRPIMNLGKKPKLLAVRVICYLTELSLSNNERYRDPNIRGWIKKKVSILCSSLYLAY